MKFKGFFVAVAAGLIGLPFLSYGQDDLSAWRQKAEQGDATAQALMGSVYHLGKGVPQNDKEAVKWFRLAADQGNAMAQYSMGFAYYSGKGVPQNYTEAVKWFRLAAEQGEADAQASLAVIYYSGQGVPRDYVQAYVWSNIAATKGHKKAAEFRSKCLKEMTSAQIIEGRWISQKYAEKFAR
jgi:TPR repeat protein